MVENYNSMDLAAFKNVWVFCEQRQGKMMPTTFAAARRPRLAGA